MSSAESLGRPAGDGDWADAGSLLPVEQQIAWEDREDLVLACSRSFDSAESGRQVLESIGFPVERRPGWDGAESWWRQVFAEFDRGIQPDPYRRLIHYAARRYSANRVYTGLRNRYPIAGREAAPETEGATCRVIVRAGAEAERTEAAEVLQDLRLDPRELWSTEHAVCYALSIEDASSLRRTLSRTELGWTVIPPGQPDYVFRELFVQGPDGSRYRVVDAPSGQTFASVAEEVVGQYDDPEVADTTRPTVIDRVREDGERERVNPTETLHEGGLADGDNVRIGFEGRAGSVNPLDRQDALDRVFKQISAFATAHSAVTVRVDSSLLPTEYEIDIRQPGFAPPPVEGGDPVAITEHTLLMELGPEFPETAPVVFWLTPVFHPNVFPTYDCDALRAEPHLQGLVCLGMLAESWHPALDFADVMQTLVEIAGYRNYELFEPTDTVTSAGAQMRVNFVDRNAAYWAAFHQKEIEDIGGSRLEPSAPGKARYPNVVFALD